MPKPKPPQSLNIGILGCANIARQFTAAVQLSPHVHVAAAASRNSDTAAAFAKSLGIPRHHGSYKALLADAAIDLIYLPLPNSLHAEWAIQALQAGKHVLCEKPMALSRAEAEAMFAAARANGVMLLEGFPYYFQPQTGDMLALLHGGAIGAVRGVQASFGFMLQNPQGNIRLNPDLGGGALLDAGSYALSLIRLVMGAAPVRVLAHPRWADSSVDIGLMATLTYGDGRSAQLSCAMDTANHRRAVIMGTGGTIETEYLNHTSAQVSSSLRIRRGTANVIPFEEIHSAMGNGFRFAAEAFAKVIAANDFAAIERAASASIDNAATLEVLAKSAKTGEAVDVPQAG
jgi:predicted dehydrogenase